MSNRRFSVAGHATVFAVATTLTLLCLFLPLRFRKELKLCEFRLHNWRHPQNMVDRPTTLHCEQLPPTKSLLSRGPPGFRLLSLLRV